MVGSYKEIEQRAPALCMLCNKAPTNRVGHFHPRLVSRCIGKYLGSQKLRFSGLPLKPYQDTIKVPFLCDAHEDQFGSYEKQFSDKLLHPYFEDEAKNSVMQYDPNFYAFLLSQSWRVLALQSLTSKWDETPEFITACLAKWGEILLDRTYGKGPDIFLLLHRDIAKERTEKHPFLNESALMLDIGHHIDLVPKERSRLVSDKAFVYVQLGPFHIFAYLGELDRVDDIPDSLLLAHRVTHGDGTLEKRSTISDELFGILFRAQWTKTTDFLDAGIISRAGPAPQQRQVKTRRPKP